MGDCLAIFTNFATAWMRGAGALGPTQYGLRDATSLAELSERDIVKRLLGPITVVIVPTILGADRFLGDTRR